jgi:hypothetical protein
MHIYTSESSKSNKSNYKLIIYKRIYLFAFTTNIKAKKNEFEKTGLTANIQKDP